MNVRRAVDKVLRRSKLAAIVADARANGLKVVSTNGCFDVLHVGHVRYLQQARALGDVLMVGLNTDASVRRLKGPSRPLVNEFERAEVLAALECVDYVTLFDEDTPVELLSAVRPDIHVKGGDYRPEDLPEAATMASIGGEVVVIPYDKTSSKGKSTSALISRMQQSDTDQEVR